MKMLDVTRYFGGSLDCCLVALLPIFDSLVHVCEPLRFSATFDATEGCDLGEVADQHDSEVALVRAEIATSHASQCLVVASLESFGLVNVVVGKHLVDTCNLTDLSIGLVATIEKEGAAEWELLQ